MIPHPRTLTAAILGLALVSAQASADATGHDGGEISPVIWALGEFFNTFQNLLPPSAAKHASAPPPPAKTPAQPSPKKASAPEDPFAAWLRNQGFTSLQMQTIVAYKDRWNATEEKTPKITKPEHLNWHRKNIYCELIPTDCPADKSQSAINNRFKGILDSSNKKELSPAFIGEISTLFRNRALSTLTDSPPQSDRGTKPPRVDAPAGQESAPPVDPAATPGL